jgi:protein phosphatase
MTGRIDVGAAQHQGSRAYQEDAFGFLYGDGSGTGSVSLILADGMGGHAGGRDAAMAATEAARRIFSEPKGHQDTDLRHVLDAAEAAVKDLHRTHPEFREGGCTFVAVNLGPAGLDWVSVGDSPLFLVSSGQVTRLNADHSMAPVLEALVEAGRLDREELANHPQIHALRSVISSEDISLIDRPGEPVSLRAGEVLILASDGICTLSTEELAEAVLRHEGSMAGLADGLVEAVLRKGATNQDNVTIICSRIEADTEEPPTRRPARVQQAAATVLRAARLPPNLLIAILVLIVLASLAAAFILSASLRGPDTKDGPASGLAHEAALPSAGEPPQPAPLPAPADGPARAESPLPERSGSAEQSPEQGVFQAAAPNEGDGSAPAPDPGLQVELEALPEEGTALVPGPAASPAETSPSEGAVAPDVPAAQPGGE